MRYARRPSSAPRGQAPCHLRGLWLKLLFDMQLGHSIGEVGLFHKAVRHRLMNAGKLWVQRGHGPVLLERPCLVLLQQKCIDCDLVSPVRLWRLRDHGLKGLLGSSFSITRGLVQAILLHNRTGVGRP